MSSVIDEESIVDSVHNILIQNLNNNLELIAAEKNDQENLKDYFVPDNAYYLFTLNRSFVNNDVTILIKSERRVIDKKGLGVTASKVFVRILAIMPDVANISIPRRLLRFRRAIEKTIQENSRDVGHRQSQLLIEVFDILEIPDNDEDSRSMFSTGIEFSVNIG